MTTRSLDKLARGPNPRDRVPVPKPSERCPRCHRVAAAPTSAFALTPGGALTIDTRIEPCLLCNPDAVPKEFR